MDPAMPDIFDMHSSGLESPASYLAEVTPTDTADLAMASRGINVAQSGAVRVTTIEDTTATLTVAAGIVMPVRVKKIWATGTTATGIVVMY